MLGWGEFIGAPPTVSWLWNAHRRTASGGRLHRRTGTNSSATLPRGSCSRIFAGNAARP